MAEENSSSGSVSAQDLAAQEQETGELPKTARARYAAALTVVAVSASLANVTLKYGMEQLPKLNSISDVPGLTAAALSNVWMDTGIFLMVFQFAALTYALRLGPLSLTLPLRDASIYVGTALLAAFFLSEKISAMRWAAIMIILAGLTLIGISSEPSRSAAGNE